MNSTWLITSKLANQHARKVLFTCVVYTNTWWGVPYMVWWGWLKLKLFPRPRSAEFFMSYVRKPNSIFALLFIQTICSFSKELRFSAYQKWRNLVPRFSRSTVQFPATGLHFLTSFWRHWFKMTKLLTSLVQYGRILFKFCYGDIMSAVFTNQKRGNNDYWNPGYLFTWENREFQSENQMVRTILFGKLQKIWAVIWGDALFCSFKPLLLMWIYFVEIPSPATSHLIV